MIRAIGMAVLLVSIAGLAFAPPGVPEIDSSSGGAALGLLAGGLIVLRAGRKKS